MKDYILHIDKHLFLFLNGLHADWLDQIMFHISGKYEWIPLYIFLFFLLVYKYRLRAVFFVFTVVLTILLADQFTSSFMKPFFARLRPSHEPAIANMVHIVNDYRGGSFGFASSHAANTFGAATIFWLIFKNHYRGAGWLFVWATLISYSRIYLGVHYPGDILVGAIVGIICAYFSFFITILFEKYISQRKRV